MTDSAQVQDFSEAIGEELPYLRRYGRALTGSQNSGDRYAVTTLEAILEDRSLINPDIGVKVSLFKSFHAIWKTAGALVKVDDNQIAKRAQSHLAKLTEDTREALLLNTIEGFSTTDIAAIMQIGRDEVRHLLTVARDEMQASVAGSVMIIEDEAIIATDLASIVAEQGHDVTGIARTRTDAVDLGRAKRPDLILADIQLADNSSGIDAVNDLLAELGDMPVIFITAFPERLLTGERPEPAFLISKPYKEEQVQSAIAQAMFFASTEILKT